MSGFDDPGLYYADRVLTSADGDDHGGLTHSISEYKKAKTTFRHFLREYSAGQFNHVYREQLKRRYNLGQYSLEVSLDDLRNYDEELAEQYKDRPNFIMPAFEEAAREVADEVTKPRPDGHTGVEDVQIIFTSNQYGESIRSLKSTHVSKLIKLSGIVIGASQVRSKATSITIQCRNCRHTRADIDVRAGLDGYALPRKCIADQPGMAQKCPLDPYVMVPDRCRCVDFQVLKLQERPEDVPHGEMPRHMQLYGDRYLTDVAAPGNRVTVVGIYSIKKVNPNKQKTSKDKVSVGLRAPYVRVLGIQLDTGGPGRADLSKFSETEIESYQSLAARPDVYERIARSIAPSIYGSEDIKKSVACLLFGGSRKRLPDGLCRRGDINVLLLGDPGTAKSQLLKFIERAAPVAVYTSGKGSSAAGLTASVIRDPTTRAFVVEGGAMVLADGGVVCIDEFDKMREDDRVAIHEAMEQQTISIAKAGITTTLNSRCSVLAAANSVFGRWDDTKGEENIDFMPTILSRFDMIFVVKDEHNERRDMTLAKHVIRVHVDAAAAGGRAPAVNKTAAAANEADTDELSLDFLKRYVSYCRSACGPRLSADAGRKLVSHYVRLRNPANDEQQLDAKGKHKRSPISITVRQLEAVVRIAESLAKMQLRPFAEMQHVDEALRLFRVSTLEAAASGSLAGAEGFTTHEDQETLSRIERQIKKRFAVGTQVSEHIIMQDFVRQNYAMPAVHKVISALIRRGDIQYRLQRKMLFRLK